MGTMRIGSGTVRATAAQKLAAGALLLALALSCAVHGARRASVQGWWKERGPVVPHDTFPADCSLCHEAGGWRRIRSDFSFDHAKETGVALEGAHAAAECLRCHTDRGPVAIFAARGCGGCHEDPHRGQMGPQCSACHDQDTWRPGEVLEMHSRTRFPLVGAHASTACYRCHPGAESGNFARADTSCEACHREDLQRATSPDHAAQGWVTDCERCHVPIAWSGGSFNHSAWPLTGAHNSVSCSQCHPGGVFTGTPDQCVDCHLDDYQNATQPDHLLFGFSTSCRQCHSTGSWHDVSFSHAGIVDNCNQCHMSDYQNASPNHVAAGFGTQCEQCHTSTSNWHQDNWVHTEFPIQSGPHGGVGCAQCHLEPTNFQSFSCTHCHDHRQSEMDDKHDDVGGYQWVSQRCFDCHPNGRG